MVQCRSSRCRCRPVAIGRRDATGAFHLATISDRNRRGKLRQLDFSILHFIGEHDVVMTTVAAEVKIETPSEELIADNMGFGGS